MSPAAQAWIGLVLAAGCATLGVALIKAPELENGQSTVALLVFLAAASIAHAFPSITPRHQAYHLTQAFLIAAVLLLAWPGVALIVLAAHLAEWIRRPRPWYIQLYNVAVYLLSAGAAMLVLWALGGVPFEPDQSRLIGVAAVAAAVLLVANHGLTAVVLRLARGVSFADSGLFGRDSLGLDGTLLLVGIAMAGAWRAAPLAALLAAAPLALIYRALRLANVEGSSHRDPLTGLYNARHFVEAFDQELRRAAHLGQPTGVIVAVLDDAPGVVHRYGRGTLDFLVAAVGERLAGTLRPYDIVARLDETGFGLLLPSLHAAELDEVAERVRSEIEGRPFGLPTTRDPVPGSLSQAMSSLPPGAVDPQTVISQLRKAADQASLLGATTVTHIPTPASGVAAERVRPAEPASVAAPGTPNEARTWSRGHLRLFQGLVIAVGIAATVWTVMANGLPDPLLAAGVLGLVILSEILAFDLYDRSSFSVNFVPILAAGLLGGPPAALVATWSAAAIRGVLRRSDWDRVLFNGSTFSIAGLAATLVVTGGGTIALRANTLGSLALTTALASSIYYLHTFLIAGALAMDLGVNPLQIWERNFRWLYPHYLLLGFMGLGMAVATVELGLPGTALFLAPPLAMRFVLAQYVERTAGSVERLESANAELRTTSDLLEQHGEQLALLSDLGQIAANEPRTGSLPALVARRCVPALGELCAVVWRNAAGLERAMHGEQRVVDWLTARAVTEVAEFAEHVADESVQAEWVADVGGSWSAAPLTGADEPLGWLLAWSNRPSELVDRHELMCEVARRLALVLERDALLEEAAELDALRVVDRAKSEFIAITAHELRTPLTSLQGYAELLRNDIEPALRDRWLRILQVEAAQLGQVVDQLLDVSRLESGRFTAERGAIDLHAVVPRVVAAFAEQATMGGHSLQADLDGVPVVYADQLQVERVLRNLVSNALKYSPGGGQVRIEAASRPGRDVEVSVADAGMGIPPEWLGRLFERFQRVDAPDRASIRGTGLGLYIARQLVELNGGRIWVTSDGLGRGSVFHFTLPQAPARS